MPTFYRGIVTGVVIAVAGAFLCVWSYGAGRASIVEQCEERRAFVYGSDAWGCVRLRKQSTDTPVDVPSPNDGVRS